MTPSPTACPPWRDPAHGIFDSIVNIGVEVADPPWQDPDQNVAGHTRRSSTDRENRLSGPPHISFTRCGCARRRESSLYFWFLSVNFGAQTAGFAGKSDFARDFPGFAARFQTKSHISIHRLNDARLFLRAQRAEAGALVCDSKSQMNRDANLARRHEQTDLTHPADHEAHCSPRHR